MSLSATPSSRCGVSLPLPVLPSGPAAPPPPGAGAGAAIRKSAMGKWRAVALIAVHLAIAAHIVQWLVSGMADGRRETLSPVEPSESMYALELGRINAGFVMFVSAILATAIFGRFFCGWACHVVALQDLCAWLMKKLGLHPKPWRSRLLLWIPLGLACYMFIWPTLRREVVGPAAVRLWGQTPVWLGEITPIHGFTTEFIVEDFWATFASWPVAIIYLFAVGFATVYFLGSKGFCAYGCPYGGFFGPVDRLSPVRIRVTDACDHCGHCTAVCTSNVRVSDEVRDYGAVVSSGCFKCLDCVSVCPKQALYLGVGLPAIFTAPRTSAAERAGRESAAKARYDLSLAEELLCLVAWLVLFRGFRGMPLLGEGVPMLMAAGLAGIGAFLLHKSLRLLRDSAVRGPRVQLKLAGRIRLAGWLFALLSAGYLTLGVQGAALWFVSASGETFATRLERLTTGAGDLQRPLLTRDSVYAPGYTPTPEAQALARQAIAWHDLARPWWRGGVGLYQPWESALRLTWLSAVAGDLPAAETHLRAALAIRPPTDDVATGLALIVRLNAGAGKQLASDPATLDRVEALLRECLDRAPSRQALYATRLELASLLAGRRKPAEAAALYEQAVARTPGDVRLVRDAATVLMNLRQPAQAAAALRAGLKARPESGPLHADLASVLLSMQQTQEGRTQTDEALRRRPREADALARLYQCLVTLGRQPEALTLAEAAARDQPRNTPLVRDAALLHANLDRPAKAVDILSLGVAAAPRDGLLRAELAAVLLQAGRKPDALAEIERVIQTGPRDAPTLEVIAYVLQSCGAPDRAKSFNDRAQAIRAALAPPSPSSPSQPLRPSNP